MLYYNVIIFAELAVKFDTQKELEHRLSAFTLLPLPLNVGFQAGKAFEKYRRAGGKILTSLCPRARVPLLDDSSDV